MAGVVGRRPRTVLKVGSKILRGRYEVTKVIHSKGMSAVYLVTDSSLHKTWCLKEIRKSDSGQDNIEYQAILDEANVMKELSHPNIPRIVTIEEEGDSIFIIMDYVEGMSLKEWLNQHGKIDIDVAVMWMRQIVMIIAYLHNLGNPIFYRDMKPDNVMITTDGSIKLLDFGISVVLTDKHMRIDKPLGTNGYAAPEQGKRGAEFDLRSDIYALGMTFYYMLTGVNISAVYAECRKKHEKFHLAPVRDVNPKIPYGLDYIIDRCIRRNPSERYQSCEELLLDLQNYTTLGTDRRNKERRKLYAFVSLLAVGVAFIGIGYFKLKMDREKEYGEYLNLLQVAQENDRRSDWLKAIDCRGNQADAYIGLVGVYKTDGIFDSSEEAEVIGLLNSNAEGIKKSQRFGELAYELGKLYWFYSEDEDYGVVSSVRWFYESKEAGYEKKLSTSYYNIGSFKKNIGTAKVEGSDEGMYKDYFNGLVKVNEAENGSLMTLQLNKETAECLYDYMPYLKKDGVDADSVYNEVESLVAFMQDYEPVEGKSVELFSELYGYISVIPDRYNEVYLAEVETESAEGETTEVADGEDKGSGLNLPKLNLDDLNLPDINLKFPDVDLGFGVEAGTEFIEENEAQGNSQDDLADKVINGYEDGGAFGEDGDLYRSGSGFGDTVSDIINTIGDWFSDLFDKIAG